jgi:hypothetical protein
VLTFIFVHIGRLRKAVGSAATVHIDTTDILGAGGALTAATGLTGLLSLLYLLLLLLRPRSTSASASAQPLATRTLPVQALSLAFCSLFLFATLIPTTDFVARRQAKVSASVGPLTLSPQAIAQTEQLLGVTGVYHKLGYREWLPPSCLFRSFFPLAVGCRWHFGDREELRGSSSSFSSPCVAARQRSSPARILHMAAFFSSPAGGRSAPDPDYSIFLSAPRISNFAD